MNRFVSSTQVLILWGHGCNEAIAAGCVATFRQQGANVTLVGLSGRRNMGAHGLTLQPDVLLSDALPLADLADLVIFPCSEVTAAALDTDPRLRDLCQRAAVNGASFILYDPAIGTLLGLDEHQTHLFNFDLDPFSLLNN